MKVVIAVIGTLVVIYVSLCALVVFWTYEYRNITDMRLLEIQTFLGQSGDVDGVQQTVSFDGIDKNKSIKVRLIYSELEMRDLREVTQQKLAMFGRPYFAYLSLIKDGKLVVRCRLPEAGARYSLGSILSGPLNCIIYLAVLA